MKTEIKSLQQSACVQRMNRVSVVVLVTGVITDMTTMTMKIVMTKQTDLEDLILWPDDTWCYRYELYEMNHMGDDYEVLSYDSDEYNKFFKEQLAIE